MNIRLKITVCLLAFVCLTTNSLNAGETLRHYKGIKPTSYAEAKMLINKYNKKIESMTVQEKITSEDLVAIHKMTYTLENALAKIKSSINDQAYNLEQLHLASEKGNIQATKKALTKYLQQF